jgi:hypothetical protein
MTAPVARGRRESAHGYALRVWAQWRAAGVPPVVTAAEAHRLAAAYGVEVGDAADHSTAVTISSLAKLVAGATPARK